MAEEFATFVKSLRSHSDPECISQAALAARLKLGKSAFAKLLRVHRNHLENGDKSAKVQIRLIEIIGILSQATTLCGDVDTAIFWFRNNPIVEFGYRTPMQIVEAGWAARVARYIDSISAGAAS
jgi:Protein of unknown function (DUF2384)